MFGDNVPSAVTNGSTSAADILVSREKILEPGDRVLVTGRGEGYVTRYAEGLVHVSLDQLVCCGPPGVVWRDHASVKPEWVTKLKL